MILMLVVMVVLLGGIFGWWIYKGIQTGKAMAAEKPPPVTVSTAKAKAETWQPELHAVGSIMAVQGVMLTSEVDGRVTKIPFQSGNHVNAGDLLVQLDISSEEAQLRNLKAGVTLAQQALARARELRQANVNSPADLDTAQAQFDQAVAAVDNLRATIAKKSITAPFAGRLGIRQVNVGEVLRSGTEIVSLEALDPVYVNFTLPQSDTGKVTAGQSVKVTLNALPGHTFTGTINAFDARLDPATRSLNIQATLPNPDEHLRPGMFVDVAVQLPQNENVITVPITAVSANPYGDEVYIVEPAKNASGPPGASSAPEPGQAAQPAAPALQARQVFVQLGDTRGDQIAIAKGVSAGDEVVTAGQLKLRNGAAVRVDNSVQVPDSPSPTPPNE